MIVSPAIAIFQSTLPREERPTRDIRFSINTYFNPRSHERSDVGYDWFFCVLTQISIHAPTRGATKKLFTFLKNECISIHAPTRGATKNRPWKNHSNNYFNPRSHERSDATPTTSRHQLGNFNPRSHERSDGHCLDLFHPSSGISIHAPTRGATSPRNKKCVADAISIHAPTRGATSPRNKKCVADAISIHAPTRGATHIIVNLIISGLFQSTLPREERQQYCTKNLFIFIQYRQ